MDIADPLSVAPPDDLDSIFQEPSIPPSTGSVSESAEGEEDEEGEMVVKAHRKRSARIDSDEEDE